MRELRQLDLQFSLKTSCPLGKDVENQAVTIQNSTVRQFLEIALLTGSQGLIDQHDVGIVGIRAGFDFLRLAGTDEVLRIRTWPGCQYETHAQGACGSRERLELSRIV